MNRKGNSVAEHNYQLTCLAHIELVNN